MSDVSPAHRRAWMIPNDPLPVRLIAVSTTYRLLFDITTDTSGGCSALTEPGRTATPIGPESAPLIVECLILPLCSSHPPSAVCPTVDAAWISETANRQGRVRAC